MFVEYVDKYDISENGELRNRLTGRILKHKTNRNRYIFYTISVDGKLRDVSAHRAVAEKFLQKVDGHDIVNHIDGDKKNNYFTNLEWSTPSKNSKHAYDNGLSSLEHMELGVVQLDKSGNIINTFKSIRSAARAVGGHSGHITNCCKGKRSTHRGYKWAYLK